MALHGSIAAMNPRRPDARAPAELVSYLDSLPEPHILYRKLARLDAAPVDPLRANGSS